MNPGFPMTSSWRIPIAASVLSVLGAVAPVAIGALEVPPLSGRVVDLAGMLSDPARVRVEADLAQLEQETGAQVAILTVPSLEGEVLEDYSLSVAEQWQLGRRQFDDGALLLIARDDRRMRLEVGYGLEGTIPDAYAKRIVDDVMRPRFRNGDFDGGVTLAVDTISGLIRGDESLPPPAEDGSRRLVQATGGGLAFLFPLLMISFFSWQALASSGCAGWSLYLFLVPFWLFFPLAVFGTPLGFVPVVIWVVAYPILRAIFRSTGFELPGGRAGGGWSSTRQTRCVDPRSRGGAPPLAGPHRPQRTRRPRCRCT